MSNAGSGSHSSWGCGLKLLDDGVAANEDISRTLQWVRGLKSHGGSALYGYLQVSPFMGKKNVNLL